MLSILQTETSLPQPKMSTKKCACFTPSGLVYTRLETDGTIARRPVEMLKENNTRSRRSISNDVYEPNTVDSILEENPSIGHLSFNSEPINEMENREAKTKIDKLIEETEAFLEAYERTKENIDHKRIKRRAQHWNNHNNKHKHKNDAIINSNESSLECKVEKSGRVNCSQVIYNDLKAWHTNRLSLEDQIRELRTKLEDLKEIKRHLKTTKPVIETQTVNPALITNHIFNKTVTREHNTTKEHIRKGRLHKMKPKHRNNTIIDKRIRQFNEYAIPTVNAKTKEDVFDMQLKNVTKTDNIMPNITNEVVNITFDAELPNPQVTTIVIEKNYLDHIGVADESTIFNVASNTVDPTTEVTKHASSTRKIEGEMTTEEFTTENYSKTVNFYTVAIDELLTTEKATQKLSTEEPTTLKPVNQTVKQTPLLLPTLLGPARLDASEYDQRNANKGVVPKDLGIFDKPVDVFKRRLHPLYIQNEDKHVCYCEEGRSVSLFRCRSLLVAVLMIKLILVINIFFNRRTKGVGHSIFEAAQRVREEQRKRKALLLRKKLRKAKKRVCIRSNIKVLQYWILPVLVINIHSNIASFRGRKTK